MHYSSGLCTPSDPNLMNARWQHLIILDPRTRLRTLLFVRAVVLIFPLAAFVSHTNKERGRPSQTVDNPQAMVQTHQHSMWEKGDPAHPFLSFIICCKRFRLMTNSILAKSSPLGAQSANWRLILPETEFPVTNGQRFSFIPPLTGSGVLILPWP